MFEKEAEEYTMKKICKNCTYRCYTENILKSNKLDCFSYARGYKIFKDGAEFGYNKGNEWHKQEVDDIYDLISEDWSVRYFICIMKDKSRVTAIGNCDEGNNGEVSVNLFFEHDDEKYYIDDIVWWKEIVLPKEIKENEKE
jgi:hypothetical protein